MFESLLVVLCGNPFFSPTFPDLLWPYTLQISTTISYCNDEIGAKRGLVRKQKQVSA